MQDPNNTPIPPQEPNQPLPTPPAPEQPVSQAFDPFTETPASAPVTTTPAGIQTSPVVAAPQASTNPGKTLGIVGFVFAFVGLQLIGIILSIMAIVKSKRAGFKNTLAVIGLVLNIVFFFIMSGIIAAIIIVSYNGINAKANDEVTKAAVTTAQTAFSDYVTANNALPTSTKSLNAKDVVFSETDITTKPASPNTVALYICGGDGVKLTYWNYDLSAPQSVKLGSVTESSSCTIIPN